MLSPFLASHFQFFFFFHIRKEEKCMEQTKEEEGDGKALLIKYVKSHT